MDDFLSKFDKNSYDKTKHAPKNEEAKEAGTEAPQSSQKEQVTSAQPIPTRAEVQEQKAQEPIVDYLEEPNSSGFESTGEVFEKDPDYQKKQKKKYTIIGIISLLVLALGWYGYDKISHVALPNFTDKPVSDARTWGSENNVKIEVEQAHNLKTEVNNVISQSPKDAKRIKKKQTLKLVVSLGADPDELIPLPNFSKMTKTEIEEWQKSVHADNVTIMEEYDEKVSAGKFIKEELKNTELQREKYTRGDQLIIYVSKGKEVYKKDIDMPDFKGKPKADVEKWAKSNKMIVTYNKVFSDDIPVEMVAGQSVKADEKIAKETKMTIDMSEGKGIKVPDFSELSMEAAGSVDGLTTQVKEVYTLNIAYGGLVSQSVPAGEMISQADSPIVKVVYSIGEPYLKSYYGLSEGELEKAFYDDYQSKGAQINYEKYYMDSSEERGTVVKMSNYNAYVGLNYTVKIGVSNGSGASAPKGNSTGEDDKASPEDELEDQHTNVKNNAKSDPQAESEISDKF